MFEKYTEKARRTIFFARYEASQFGSPYIETEHLLLGLLREDKALTNRFLRGVSEGSRIRRQIENATTIREKVSTSVDLPLSNECKRVLKHAADETEKLGHKHIGTEHLVLGILRETKSFAAQLLTDRGVRLETFRAELKQSSQDVASATDQPQPSALSDLTDDLTQLAGEGQLYPVIARDAELDRLSTVLCRSTKRNAVLVGERGAGKATIVEGLAQRLVQGSAPSLLAAIDIVELDVAQVVRGSRSHSKQFIDQARHQLANASGIVFFMEEMFSLLSGASTGDVDISELIKDPLLAGTLQCIAAATPDEHRRALEKHPWLESCFTMIEIQPMSVVETVEVLRSVSKRFEEFHWVTYTEESLQRAAFASSIFVKDRYLPEKAIDLIDEAAAFVKAHGEKLPPEIIEI